MRKQVVLSGQNQILQRPVPDESDLLHTLHTIYYRSVCKSMMQLVLRSTDTSSVWN